MEKYDILYVVDEVQTGFGRTGKMFAIEHWGVEPDIMCLAKSIASGMPLGAMVARKSLMTWEAGAHASTFGGNPICCAAALETIKLIEASFMENAARMGQRIMDHLEGIKDDHPSMGDVRGKGLMIGIELVKDKETRKSAPELRNEVIHRAFHKGLLILGCGPNTVRFMPALNISQDIADEGLAIFEEALSEVEREAGL
jgi:4-aminobutyrate aminotransferase